MIKYYNKLIRDNIPQIIFSEGKYCITDTLSQEEYIYFLDQKLNEELNEYHESKSIEELADLLEVIYALVKARGWSIEQLESSRLNKAATHGGFERKILLKAVSTQPISQSE